MDPLHQVLVLFHNPVLLVGKRRDKLLDYDSLRHDLDRTVEPERLQQLKEQCTMAKRYVGGALSHGCHVTTSHPQINHDHKLTAPTSQPHPQVDHTHKLTTPAS